MNEKILICVAWPYANGSLHIGQTAGAYIPADIFARYHRAKGNDVLMVSGSDSHGTPVTLTAEDLGISPKEVFQKYHQEFVKNWEELGITFDLFTSTHTKNHQKVAQDIFLKLYEKKLIYKDFMTQPFCEQDQRFLADRYVNGTCPKCNDKNARGDQCDSCGITLDPKDLIDMKCKLCDSTPKLKKTEHFFLKLSNFQDTLLSWLETKDTWKPNVKNFSMSYIKSGLKDRPITRDIEWGIPVPLKNYENKKLYAVSDAVDLPVLILGGAGNWNHFLAGFNEGHASAVCTQNIYHFTTRILLDTQLLQICQKIAILISRGKNTLALIMMN